MAPEISRRTLLSGLAAAAAARSAPLPNPPFYWGIGIENCWIAQTDPAKDGNRRLLDVFLQMQHYEKWKQDLDLAADVGVNCIRYSVPWYMAEPKPGVYDWSWIDKPIEYLVNKLKIIPVMDLIHYGTPKWMPDGVVDERFPEAIGAYAGAMAAHFKGLVNHYSPHNEPQLTCLFCGLNGRWPPYQTKVESWARIGIQAAKGMVLETEAIRKALPNAVIISVDPWFPDAVDKYLQKPADPAKRTELENAAAVYPASLAYGKVRPGDLMAVFLESHGVKTAEIEWFLKRKGKPDILGYNYYPDIFAFRADGDYTRKGKVPLEQAAREAADLTKQGIIKAQSWFQLPVYLTETSAGLSTPAKQAFIRALYDMVRELRSAKVPMVGVNWWPLFNTIQWDYREKTDKPLKDFLYSGGWNNGLYVTEVEADGDLKRVKTPAADTYHEVIHRKL